jgi:hypothetical protein
VEQVVGLLLQTSTHVILESTNVSTLESCYGRGLKLKFDRRATFQRKKRLRGPQFTRKMLLRVAIYKKGPQNLIKFFKSVSFGDVHGPHKCIRWAACLRPLGFGMKGDCNKKLHFLDAVGNAMLRQGPLGLQFKCFC